MVSSRDRSHSQRRDSLVRTVARTPPPAFLFPNQRCQRPDRLRRPHRLTPVAGGGGYLRAAHLGVNRSFRTFSPRPKLLKSMRIRRKIRSGPPGGCPKRSVAIRLNPGKIVSSRWKASDFRHLRCVAEMDGSSRGRRLSRGRPRPCQPSGPGERRAAGTHGGESVPQASRPCDPFAAPPALACASGQAS